MNNRVGIDGKNYAIQFELRVPYAWNTKFFYQGGSGTDGVLFTALGAYPGGGTTRNALLDGYAVVTTDSGHETDSTTVDGAYLFGAEPTARYDWGDQQIPQVSAAAKTLLKKIWATLPERSYFVGCSTGGRQAMVAAQRYPDIFDGIVAGSPGFRIDQAAMQAIHQAQLSAAVAPIGAGGTRDISNTLTAAEQAIVKQKILDACDTLDGVADGMISKPSACHPDPAQWACTTSSSTNCLMPVKANYVAQLFNGTQTSSGALIYNPWPMDPGMILQSSNPFINIYAGEASHVFTTPPTVTTDLLGYALNANIDTEYAKLSATNSVFTRSANDSINAESPDMDAFDKRGGKLIMYNGTADLAFSALDASRYYDQVEARYGETKALSFSRLYLVPGMAHCSGGTGGTDQFDAFGAVVNWVEKGDAPDTITSTARAAAGVLWPGRTRPLCTYPKEAVYNGSGSIEDAANFSCA